MSSHGPDEHFKLSRTSVGHSEPELQNSVSGRYAATTFRNSLRYGGANPEFWVYTKKNFILCLEILFFTNKNSD